MASDKYLFAVLCLVIFLGCKTRHPDQNQSNTGNDTKRELSGNFTITGADALYPLITKLASEFTEIHPAVKIKVVSGGTGRGLNDLLDKKCDLAMISRVLTDSEMEAGVWTIPVAKDGVAAIINQKNPYFARIMERGLNPAELLKVFTDPGSLSWGELLDTKGKEKVKIFIRDPESGAAGVFAGFLNKESSDLKGTIAVSDDEMIKSIRADHLAIGFCNFSYAFDVSTGDRSTDIQVVPADLNYNHKLDRKELPFSNLEKAHRGLWLGLYPKSLCRELSVGSIGKPADETVIEFLKYVLTEGQNEVKSYGLCELNDVYVGYALDMLK